MANDKFPQTVTLEDSDGVLYTATKTGQNEAWDIAHPTGGDRFYGTVPEVRARMKDIVTHREAEMATEVGATP